MSAPWSCPTAPFASGSPLLSYGEEPTSPWHTLLVPSLCLLALCGAVTHYSWMTNGLSTENWSTLGRPSAIHHLGTVPATAKFHHIPSSQISYLRANAPAETKIIHLIAQRTSTPHSTHDDNLLQSQGALWTALLVFLPAAFVALLLGRQVQHGDTSDVGCTSSAPSDGQFSRRLMLQGITLAPGLLSPSPASAGFLDPILKFEITRMKEINAADAQILINDFSAVVAQQYYDAFNNGFDLNKWDRLTTAALEKTYQYREEVYAQLSQMLSQSNVDEYTYFLRPEELQAMTKYDVSGVGLNLITAEEYSRQSLNPASAALGPLADDEIMVVSVLVGSTAEKAGVKVGDIIEQVDGVPVKGRAPFQVMTLIRGEDSDDSSLPATLQLRRGIDGQMATIDVPRLSNPNAPEPVKAELKTENVGGRTTRRGYITLSEFNSRAPASVKAAVQRLEAEGAESFILDLRNNPGGLAQDAVEIAGLFLGGERPITYTVSNSGALLEKPDPGIMPITSKPLIVRVNFASASAAEILAAALRDNCRAPLVGTRTFGKAVIQGIYQFPDGSGVKITIGKYLTPLRRDISRRGIDADFFMLPSEEEALRVIGTQCTDALLMAGSPAS